MAKGEPGCFASDLARILGCQLNSIFVENWKKCERRMWDPGRYPFRYVSVRSCSF